MKAANVVDILQLLRVGGVCVHGRLFFHFLFLFSVGASERHHFVSKLVTSASSPAATSTIREYEQQQRSSTLFAPSFFFENKNKLAHHVTTTPHRFALVFTHR